MLEIFQNLLSTAGDVVSAVALDIGKLFYLPLFLLFGAFVLAYCLDTASKVRILIDYEIDTLAPLKHLRQLNVHIKHLAGRPSLPARPVSW